MIVHTTCAKVGHRQAPLKHQALPLTSGEGFVLCMSQNIRREYAPWQGSWRQRVLVFISAGLPALQRGEPGQIRKEAATATHCECRGKARHLHFLPPVLALR